MKISNLAFIISLVFSLNLSAQNRALTFNASIPNGSETVFISESDIDNKALFAFECPSDLPLKFLVNKSLSKRG